MGEVLRGRRDALAPGPGNLGPTLEFRRGERVRIDVVNRTGEETVIHWHGMIVPDAADGHPRQAVRSGESYTVDFTVRNGLIVVREPAEREIGLPIWTFTNDGPGMSMAHPMHIHGSPFRIVERSGGVVPADLRDGIVDAGYKDVFGIFPGERVRVQVAPTTPGLFMYHCHNLEHEDGGMMRNVLFEA